MHFEIPTIQPEVNHMQDAVCILDIKSATLKTSVTRTDDQIEKVSESIKSFENERN